MFHSVLMSLETFREANNMLDDGRSKKMSTVHMFKCFYKQCYIGLLCGVNEIDSQCL